MNKPQLAQLALLTLAVGCATTPLTKTITIDSDPQGVRVEVNGEDLGKTPTSYAVRTNPEGEFLGAWAHAPVVEFSAYPPPGSQGLYKQVKVFQPNGFFKAGDKIPSRIFFDLHQKPERFQLNIETK